MALCLALFTLAVTAGNRGFLSIGDWLKCYQRDLMHDLEDIKAWPGLKSLVRVESERQLKYGGQLCRETETRYYIASFLESAESFAQHIRGYWGVENKVQHVRDVTQGEDASHIRMHQLPQIFAVLVTSRSTSIAPMRSPT